MEAYRLLKENKLDHLLILQGAEPYLVDDFLEKIRSHYGFDGSNELNELTFDASKGSLESLSNFLLGLGFFSDQKLCIVKNLEENSSLWDDFRKLCEQVEEHIIVVLYPGKCKLKGFTTVDMKRITKSELPRWITKQFSLRKKRINDRALQYMISFLRYDEWGSTTDLYFILNEILKLCSTSEEVITEERVMKNIDRPLEDNVFELISEVSNRKTENAMRRFREYKKAGGDLHRFLSIMTSTYSTLMVTKELTKRGYPLLTVMDRTDVKKEFAAKKNLGISNQYSKEELWDSFDRVFKLQFLSRNETVSMEREVESLLLQLLRK